MTPAGWHWWCLYAVTQLLAHPSLALWGALVRRTGALIQGASSDTKRFTKAIGITAVSLKLPDFLAQGSWVQLHQDT